MYTMASNLSYRDIGHPTYQDSIKGHNQTTLKLVRTGRLYHSVRLRKLSVTILKIHFISFYWYCISNVGLFLKSTKILKSSGNIHYDRNAYMTKGLHLMCFSYCKETSVRPCIVWIQTSTFMCSSRTELYNVKLSQQKFTAMFYCNTKSTLKY